MTGEATDELFPIVYDTGTQRTGKINAEKAGLTLGATELVHEAYLRLLGGNGKSEVSSRSPRSAVRSPRSAVRSQRSAAREVRACITDSRTPIPDSQPLEQPRPLFAAAAEAMRAS